ncbi:uncharacterized protein JCM10292_006763 [Rhodotorula paludigena]|uniref:uncharacterized protein n=1 Tax=Rhodotorula paludigena TaxID=86838 RepID=UPI00317FFB94
MPTAPSVARQLTRAALPLVPEHGFTADTLLRAAASVPALPAPLPGHALHALFPSPPVAQPAAFSLRGLAIGNGGRRSLSRQELIALARREGTAPRDRERTGPARALVHEWLAEGRRVMVDRVRSSGLKGDKAVQVGLRERLRYNEGVLDQLPQALALLTAPTSTYLSDLRAVLPVPSPTAHLYHVAQIAQDLAKASGSEAQGTDWYSLRLRLGTVYALSELSLLAPSSSSLPAPDRIAAAVALSEQLLDRTGQLGKDVENVGLFAEWVRKSWVGIGRSVLA